MTQAILTKFIPCTDTKPNRVKAFCDAGSIIIVWKDNLNTQENHERAARALVGKLGWFYPNGTWCTIIASLPKNLGGYVFVKSELQRSY